MTKEQSTRIMEFVEKINDAQVRSYNAENDLMEKRIDLAKYLDDQIKATEQENSAKIPYKSERDIFK